MQGPFLRALFVTPAPVQEGSKIDDNSVESGYLGVEGKA